MNLKILHTESSKIWGGRELRITRECSAFMERGCEVMIACQPYSWIGAQARKKHIPIATLKMRKAFDLSAIICCVGILRNNGIHLVHTHASVDSWCFSLAARFLKLPVVRSRHISTPISKSPLSFFLYMKLADRVITSGLAIREAMIRTNRMDPKRIVSIPAGVDEKVFHPNLDGGHIRSEFNLNDQDFVIGVVAGLHGYKGHSYLIESVENICSLIPTAKLFIVGDGPLKGHIKHLITSKGLDQRVIMTGYREDIPELMKNFDLFILPSIEGEGVAQVIPQAMLVGIPIIATDVGCTREVVINKETGLLVPPHDALSLAQAILWMYRDRSEAKKLAYRARQYALNHFTLTTSIDKTEEVYKSLLQNRP